MAGVRRREMECVSCGIPLTDETPHPEGMSRHYGRGLCAREYQEARRAGMLHLYPRINADHAGLAVQ